MSLRKINDETVENVIGEFFICLNATGWKHAEPFFKNSHMNVINSYFDDVEQDGPKEIQWFNNTTKTIEAKAITVKQAIELKLFIETIPDNSTVYVYCAKGLSRSAAVESYISEIKNNVILDLPGMNPRVYKFLKEV
jgi:rhodanese-related sulfurtransferase